MHVRVLLNGFALLSTCRVVVFPIPFLEIAVEVGAVWLFLCFEHHPSGKAGATLSRSTIRPRKTYRKCEVFLTVAEQACREVR